MGATRHRRPRAHLGPVRWLGCRLRTGNPLRRGSDRAEGVCALLAVLLILVAVPVTVLIGLNIAGSRAEAAARARAERRPATAVLLAEAPDAVGVAADGAAGSVPVRARWSYRHHPRTGTVEATPGLHRGARVPIWLDRHGRPVAAPPSGTQVTMSSAGTGLGLLFAIVASVGTMWLVLRWLLDRARFAAWEREWRRVNPHGNHWVR
ncbi:membrane protein [Actinocatenispora thailandica]|uniref:Membrane protein n=1 Tax=Actinocatenispora thailandica TaxID=227318 RepID=A0A7R7DRF6_9ACTN|nr:hypothetical protein [Actinocatenispora thailandica]BCJ36316.1 membrane protein [Actinocatenispora thailandica]